MIFDDLVNGPTTINGNASWIEYNQNAISFPAPVKKWYYAGDKNEPTKDTN